jgi:hypothetical protein
LFALSLTFRVAVRDPVAVGVNFTLIVHDECAATLPAQLSVSPKSPGSAPVNPMVMESAVVRLFLSVTDFAALLVRTVCFENVNEVGLTVAWATPVPLSEEVSVWY